MSAILLALMLQAADHAELEATLHVPLQARTQARTFRVQLSVPGPGAVRWRVDLLSPAGRSVLQWRGKAVRELNLPLSLRRRPHLPQGLYAVRLRAGDIEQSWQTLIGPAPQMTALGAIARPPFTVYQANLHSQTGDSDGGGALPACHSAQAPQSSPLGPLDAYAYARQHGLQALMTSEHNHLYDGADGLNLKADPDLAIARFQRGLQSARDFSTAHPDFVALYGMEWGVIDKGGHMNIFNADQLLGWEHNAQGQLIAELETPKGDYAHLYTLMQARGWIGQFNHPQSSQFNNLAYHPAGDASMALCEVLNTSAFSANDSETETRRSTYQASCDKLLEAGFHLAFSSNQDNHCANWGASYTNRTGILIPAGSAYSRAAVLEAIQARRVFATMDKQAELILTANGHMMGERFDNTGPLELQLHYAHAAQRSLVAIVLFDGVPGRNGQIRQSPIGFSATLQPSPGAHFYYVRVTQNDGNMLWSAPIWVTQTQHSPSAQTVSK